MCVAYVLLAVSHDSARSLPLAAAMRNALRVCLSQVVPPVRLPLGRASVMVSESAAVQESLRRHDTDGTRPWGCLSSWRPPHDRMEQ